MSPARAAYTYIQIRLTFMPIEGQKVVQQVAKPTDRLAYLCVFVEKLDDLRIITCQIFQFFVEIRIRQVPDIKEKIQVPRCPILMAKTNNLYFKRRSVRRRSESLSDQTSKCMYCVLRGINDKVCQRAYFFHCSPFVPDRGKQSLP